MPPNGPFISERKRRPVSRRWWVYVVAALVVLAITGYIVVRNRTADVRNGDKVEFTAPTKPPPADVGDDWPFYHYDLAHTAHISSKLKSPFKRRWLFSGKVLLEFPPIAANGNLFLIRNNGSLYSLDAETGKVRWKLRVGRCAASSPAYADRVVYVTVLSVGSSCNSRSGNGRIIALTAGKGRRLWRRTLPSRTESSPIVSDGSVFIGSENGTVYALSARNGSVKWTYKAGGAVKASPALSGGTLYFGDYGGNMNAVWARTGKRRWSSGTSGAGLGFSSGTFYSTPAVAFGRVFAGNADNKVYSFGADTGKLAWSKSTGGYVYSSPAVASFPKVGPTVYIGSYDGNMYALDARSGSTRWTAGAGGRISGGVSIVGHVAYFADLDSKATYGVDARTGKRVFRFPRGSYNPVISDGKTLYVTGYASVTALEPKNP